MLIDFCSKTDSTPVLGQEKHVNP